MMFRQGGPEDQDLGNGSGNTGLTQHQQQQLQQMREQEIMREARAAMAASAAAAAGRNSFSLNSQDLRTSFTLPSSSLQEQTLRNSFSLQQQQQPPSMEQQLEQQRQQQQQHQQQFSGNNSGGAGNAFSLQRMEAQMQAQTKIQAEARVKALLDQEAQLKEQLLQLRQRQLSSPSTTGRTSFSSMGAGGSGVPDSFQLESPGTSAGLGGLSRAAGLWSPGGGMRNSFNMPNFGTNSSLNNNPMMGSVSTVGSNNSTNNSFSGNTNNKNHVLPDSRIRDEEAMVFGKISSHHQAAADALQVQARHAGIGLSDSTSIQNRNDKLSKDGSNYKQHQLQLQQETQDGSEQADDLLLEEEDEDDKLDDDEYFQPSPGEPNGDGSYPSAREAFPIKLYRILHEAKVNQQDDIISFFPHGRAFAVHKSKEFTRDIMPKYFPAGRMNTFLKQLNLYGFRRITEGRDKGGYFHKDFILGKRPRCKKIKRKKVHSKPAASAMSQQQSHLNLPMTSHSQLAHLSGMSSLDQIYAQPQQHNLSGSSGIGGMPALRTWGSTFPGFSPTAAGLFSNSSTGTAGAGSAANNAALLQALRGNPSQGTGPNNNSFGANSIR